MGKGLFLTGTDTGIGKTVVACALAAAARSRGIDVAVFKPVETGCKRVDGRLVGEDVAALIAAAGSGQAPESAASYLFELPASPMTAAAQAGGEACPEKIAEDIEALRDEHDLVIIEGAGGLKVPVAEGVTWLEIMEDIDVPVICVVADRLGCLNHALLTLDALEHESVDVMGFVMTKVTAGDKDPTQGTNADLVESFTGARNLGALPHFNAATCSDPEALAQAAADHLNLELILGPSPD